MDFLLTTDRLILRHLEPRDLDAMKAILQDEETMRYYTHAFPDEEVLEWYNRQQARYADKPYLGLQAVILKSTDEMIGLCGLTRQQTDSAHVIEVGYLFNRRFWHNGYAHEASNALISYGFSLGINEIYSIIRDVNDSSRRVALRNGMKKVGSFTKHYYGIDMPHDVYCISRDDYANLHTEQCIIGIADKTAEQ